MPDPVETPIPWKGALASALLVLAGYVFTLAPTVTFWDAGELIAASKILGIPHPPGTPLFVLLAHVWGAIVPFGEFAWRTNLLTAMFSASAAGCWYMVVHEALVRATTEAPVRAARWLRTGGAMAAVVLAAFTFTAWQNSNETEVYSVATFVAAAMAWLCLVWRRRRGSPASARILFLIVYLAGVSIGNHLLSLLAGPGVLLFMAVTLRREPAADRETARREWSRLAVLAGVWALVVGMGLGNTALMVMGGVLFLIAAVFAALRQSALFAVVALLIASVGITSYGYLYIRAGQHPVINEAQPDNFDALLDVIRRAQYPVRTPLDDPNRLHGPDNPGRSLVLLGAQTANYIQYFDWQWARDLRGGIPLPFGTLPWRTLFTLAMASLGLTGLALHRRADPAGFWLLCGIFLVTGIGLVLYMNFRPGYSIFYDRWPSAADHEVRERDYFFVVSFVIWGLWAGMGLVRWAGRLLAGTGARRVAGAAVLGLALIPFALNFHSAGRRHGPDATLAADFAYDVLNSVPPYGVLFTFGDNDTFPLWWAQEVAGIRRDVTIVCLALANTPWYMRQLRDYPVRPFDEATAPPIWQGRNPTPPDFPLHTLSDREIDAIVPTMLPRDLTTRVGAATYVIPAETPIYPSEVLEIKVMQQNAGRRPVVLSLTTGRNFHGLGPWLLQRGLGYHLQNAVVDSTSPDVDARRVAGVLLDVPTTRRLVWETFRYGRIFEGDLSELDPTSRGIAWNLSLPFTQLAWAWGDRGNLEEATRNLERAAHLAADPALRALLRQAENAGPRQAPDTP